MEADISGGLPRTVLVGLADTALYEARDRCKAAVTNSGHQWPSSLLTINLSPATLPKRGGHYDLAIVAAVLAADGVLGVGELAETVLLGELGLDGRVRPVRDVLPATLAAASAGFRWVIAPHRLATTEALQPARAAYPLTAPEDGVRTCVWPSPFTNSGKDDSPKPGTNFRSRNNSACSDLFRRP